MATFQLFSKLLHLKKPEGFLEEVWEDKRGGGP